MPIGIIISRGAELGDAPIEITNVMERKRDARGPDEAGGADGRSSGVESESDRGHGRDSAACAESVCDWGA